MSAANKAREKALQRLSRLHRARTRREAIERQRLEQEMFLAEREQRALQKAQNDPFGQIGSAIGSVVGGAVGMLGGPAGAAIGSSLGGMGGGALATGIRAADSGLDSDILWGKYASGLQGQVSTLTKGMGMAAAEASIEPAQYPESAQSSEQLVPDLVEPELGSSNQRLLDQLYQKQQLLSDDPQLMAGGNLEMPQYEGPQFSGTSRLRLPRGF